MVDTIPLSIEGPNMNVDIEKQTQNIQGFHKDKILETKYCCWTCKIGGASTNHNANISTTSDEVQAHIPPSEGMLVQGQLIITKEQNTRGIIFLS